MHGKHKSSLPLLIHLAQTSVTDRWLTMSTRVPLYQTSSTFLAYNFIPSARSLHTTTSAFYLFTYLIYLHTRTVVNSFSLIHTVHYSSQHISIQLWLSLYWRQVCTVWVKRIPPTVLWNFFPNGWEFLITFLHTYYVIISTLDYKFLFNYLQLWQSYAIQSATT